MSNFGWSYPPGCSGTPYDEEYPCAVCGHWEDACICPECPECSAFGDPDCYEKHSLVRTKAQIESLAKHEAQWKADAEAEAKFWEQIDQANQEES